MELHYSKPERNHDWVEQIVLTPPGKYPSDLIEKESISLVNMKGEIKNYLWHEKLEIEMPEPKSANISYVNLKSEYRPFIIVPPDPVNSVEGVWDSPYFRTYAANMARRAYRRQTTASYVSRHGHFLLYEAIFEGPIPAFSPDDRGGESSRALGQDDEA